MPGGKRCEPHRAGAGLGGVESDRRGFPLVVTSQRHTHCWQLYVLFDSGEEAASEPVEKGERKPRRVCDRDGITYD